MSGNDTILVEVKGVSKKFSRTLKRSLLYGLRDVGRAMLGLRSDHSELRKDEFWAIRNISFTLRRGECIGLIGRNGAGKSTLLKMLNGLILPDEGSIVMRGKVSALIELGAGFNPLLTGRENIYINGQLLGFTKKEIDEKMEAILSFAEIGAFVDSPVQNYSSGMKVRLGFAVAAQLEPDVLIIDEVLAVGDLGFVLKCFNRIDALLKNTAVIFVSHSMPQVSRVSTGIVMLEKGQAIFQGSDISAGIDMYYSRFAENGNNKVVFDRGEDAALLSIVLGEAAQPQGNYMLNRLEDLVVHFELRVRAHITKPYILLTVFDKEQRPVGICQSDTGLGENNITRKEGEYVFYTVKVVLPRINLSKGLYSLSFSVTEGFRSQPLLRLQSVCSFQVLSPNDVWPPVEFEGKWS